MTDRTDKISLLGSVSSGTGVMIGAVMKIVGIAVPAIAGLSGVAASDDRFLSKKLT
ncbi:hypothetical protein ADILRU_0555 [Leifsonia rubra CMS 76R]|nr:hypothetical protein ADILRU_0555 [Leifsonia rubra CMS 76R]